MNNCKKCGNDLPRANLFCSHCGTAQEVSKKPNRWIGILIAVVSIGTAITIYFGKDNLFNKEIEDVVYETPSNSSEIKEEVEESLFVVQQTSKTKSIEELEKNAIYSSVVQSGSDEAKVFIVPTSSDGFVTFGPDDISFMGEEGDDVYTGGIHLYLVEVGGDKGYLQKDNDEETLLNLTREPFRSYTIDGKTLITVHEAVTSNHFEMSLWKFDNGQMTLVDTLGTSTTKLKILEDKYIQTYSYNNGDPLGWTFYTYEWVPVNDGLSLIDTHELIIEDDLYDWEAYFDAYKDVVDEWNTYPHAYVAFPHISIPTDFVKQLNKGMFLGKKIPLGESIDSFIKKNPNHLGTDYYAGGKYYDYPSGELYFFDENTRKINHFAYGAGSLETTITELIELIGEPIEDTGDISEDDDAYDYYIANPHMMTFDLGKFDLNVEYEDDEIYVMWFYHN